MDWVKRFIFNCRKGKEERRAGELTAAEIQEAKLSIIRFVQEESFPVEYLALKNGQRPLRSSPLTGLRPYFDEKDQVIRLIRRTKNSTEEAEDAVVLTAPC